MNRLDLLHDLLDDRAEAMGVLERDLADVRSRARHRRRAARVAGAATSVAVLGAAAVTAVATGGGTQDVRTRGASPADGTSTATLEPYSRDLPGGGTFRASITPPEVTFGPYGAGDRWVQPEDCPAEVVVSVRRATDSVSELIDGASRTESGQTFAAFVPRGDATAAVVVRPVPGARYRLVEDGRTLDEQQAGHELLGLLGESAASPPASTSSTLIGGPSGDVHVQRLDASGAVAEDQIPRRQTGTTATAAPSGCAPPSTPAGLAHASTAGAIDGAAITAAVASMLPPSSPWIDGLAQVDDPDGALHALLKDATTASNVGVSAEDVHLVSPTDAWVRYGFRLAGSGSVAAAPAVFENWAEVRRLSSGWKVTSASYCALLAPTGPRCADTPRYTPLHQAGTMFTTGADDSAPITTTTTTGG